MRTFLAIAFAVLALAPAASAKELQAITFCGPTGCRTFDDEATLRDVPTGGETTRPLGRAAPYYGVSFAHGGGHASFGMFYVPSANALVGHDETGHPRYHPIFGATATELMRRLTRGLEPFPVPRVTSVKVGDRVVTGDAAQTYLTLFERASTGGAAWDTSDWFHVDLRSNTPSPWTSSEPELIYSSSANKLLRGHEVTRLDDRTAANLEAARPLDARSRPFAWTIAFAALGALSLATLSRRRRT